MTPGSSPTIAIIGAGAVGGYYGGRLAQHGHDVHFLLRSDHDAWRRGGLHVRSIDGDFHLPPERLHVYDDPAAMPKADLVLVTIKTTENHQLGALIRPLLRDGTAILTLQNGLGNEQLLAGLFGAERVLGGMAFTCINRAAPGHVHHIDHGFIRLGEFAPAETGGESGGAAGKSGGAADKAAGAGGEPSGDVGGKSGTPGGGKSERAERIARLLTDSRVPASAIDDLRAGRWDKQVWNVPFNGLGALLDAPTDRLVGNEEGERLVRAVMREVLEAARADGVDLPPDAPEKKIAATRSMGAYLSSTQIDRRLGKPMEVEAIFGEPVRVARRAGLHLPLLEMLYFSLKQVG